MATNETAALVVALSAQVAKFQKDMDQANAIANKSVKQIEDRFAAAGKVISDRFAAFAVGATAQLGTVGAVLAAFGPAGAAAAVGLGAMVQAFNALVDSATKFGEKALALREFSQTTGLTVAQIQGLGEAAKKVGIDSDRVETFITRLSVAFAKLKETGTGELADQLVKISPDMLRAVAGAKSFADAIDLISKAVAGLTDQEQKNLLVASAIGQRNVEAVRLFEQLAKIGGIQGALQARQAAGKSVLDAAEVDKAADAYREILELNREIEKIQGRMFSGVVNDSRKASLQFWLDTMKQIDALKNVFTLPSAPAPLPPTAIARRGLGPLADRPFTPDDRATKEQQLLEFGRERLRVLELEERKQRDITDRVEDTGDASKQVVPVPPERPNAAVELSLLQRRNAVVGDAIRQDEQLTQKQLEQEVAFKAGGVTLADLTRGLEAFNLAQAAARLAAAERVGVATDEQIALQRLAELQAQYNKGLLTRTQLEQARIVVARQVKDEQEQQAALRSPTPEFTRALQESNNLLKQFDRLSVSAMNNTADALADVVTGTKKLNDALRDLAQTLARDFARAAFRSILSQIFAPGVASGGNFLSGLFGGARQGGGSVTAGRSYLVGEHGPEMFVPGASGMVVPNGAVRSAGAGATVIINNNVDATGADTAAVTRLTTGLAAVNRSIEPRAVAALKSFQVQRA